MAIDWQTIAAVACVGLATIVVVMRAVKLLRGSGGSCGTGGCHDCPQVSTQQPQATLPPLVVLDETPPPLAGASHGAASD